jgi:Ribbon-helix-helix protein, copG family
MKQKKKKSNRKPKLNITLHEDTKRKLSALAELEKRSVSNLIEIMADERWEQLAEREGVNYAKTLAQIAGLKGLSADKAVDRKVFRREILERVLKYKKR